MKKSPLDLNTAYDKNRQVPNLSSSGNMKQYSTNQKINLEDYLSEKRMKKMPVPNNINKKNASSVQMASSRDMQQQSNLKSPKIRPLINSPTNADYNNKNNQSADNSLPKFAFQNKNNHTAGEIKKNYENLHQYSTSDFGGSPKEIKSARYNDHDFRDAYSKEKNANNNKTAKINNYFEDENVEKDYTRKPKYNSQSSGNGLMYSKKSQDYQSRYKEISKSKDWEVEQHQNFYKPPSSEKTWRKNIGKNLSIDSRDKQMERIRNTADQQENHSPMQENKNIYKTSLSNYITQVNKHQSSDDILKSVNISPHSSSSINLNKKYASNLKPKTPLQSPTSFINKNPKKDDFSANTNRSTSSRALNNLNKVAPKTDPKNKKWFIFPDNKGNSSARTWNSNSYSAHYNNERNNGKYNSATPSTKSSSSISGFNHDSSFHGKICPYYMQYIEKAYRTPIQNDYFSELYRQHFLQTCQGILYSTMARPADPNDLSNKKVKLNRRRPGAKKTYIFDLDETLIHCNENTSMPADVILSIKFPQGEVIEAGINIRPYAIDLLKDLSEDHEIVVFTASHSCYAQTVLNYLDPEHKYIHHKFYREHCIQTPQGVYIKDMRIFSDRSLAELVIIDNAAYSFSFQIDNGIPIIPFYDNKQDVELKRLLSYLKSLSDVKDVREPNKYNFKLHAFNDPEGPQKVFDKIFRNKDK